MRLTLLHYFTITILSIQLTHGQNAPVFNSTPITSINEDTAYEYVIDVTDPNGDEIAISVTAGTNLPLGLELGTTTPSKTVSTLAGSSSGSFMMGYFGGHNDGNAPTSLFNGPGGVAIDANGNIFVADANNHCIRKIATDGTISTFAGTVTGGFGTAGDVDGLGTAAKFNTPTDLVFDTNGNLYVTDKGNHKIKRITPTGQVNTFVGSGSSGSANGFGTGASFNSPTAITIAPNGLFYVADAGNHRIRRITSIGIVSTLAGSSMGYNDATGNSAQFNQPEGIAVDGEGNIYVADTYNFRIRKITSSGVVTTIAGSGTNTTTDGQGAAATFSQPTGIAVNANGIIYVTDWLYGFVREIDANNNVTTIAGMSINDPMGSAHTDGSALNATFYRPNRMTVTTEGHLIIADGNHRIRQLTIDNGDPALIGSVDLPGTYSISITASDGPNSTDQSFNLVVADILSVDSPDEISIAENHTGVYHTFTGSGPLPFTFAKTGGADASLFTINSNTGELSLSGSALDFENPSDQYLNNTYEVDVTVNDGINTGEQTLVIHVTNVNEAGPVLSSNDVNASVDENESVTYPIAATDADHDAITYSLASASALPPGLTLNQEDETYTVSLFSGDNLPNAGDVDGDATTSRYSFNSSSKIIANKVNSGFLVLQASGFPMASNVIRQISADGSASKLQDQHGATITLSGLGGIDMDASGDVYVGDAGANQIKRITSTGIVSVFSGSGSAFTFDGASNMAGYQNIKDVAINSAGEVYVAQSTRIRKLDATGAVTTVAGGNAMRSDGTGTAAGFLDIIDIAFDQFDDLYILEASRYVRKMDKSYEVTSIAGGASGSIDGTGTAAGFNTPISLAVTTDGNLLIGENFKIRKVTPEGEVTTFSGSNLGQTNGDISNAAYGFPSGMVVLSSGKIILADWYYHNLRELAYIPPSANITGAILTAGTYSFAISASDGTLSTDQSFDIQVADVTSPVFTSGTSFDWDENESGIVFIAAATDPSTLTYNFDGASADNDLFAINATSGEVSFLSSPDFETPLDDDMDNVYDIGVTATDGTNSTTSIIAISVADISPSESLTVTANDQTRTYGAGNPTFTVTFDGLSGLDNESDFNVTTSTSADEFTSPGTYDIIPALNLTGIYLDKYTLTLNNGTLSVDKAPLSVTADDQTKVYAEGTPLLSASYSGFRNGESELDLITAPLVTTQATTSSDAGTYDIVVNGGVSDNYDFSYTSGTLTIDKASLFVTIDDQTKVYGDALPELTVSYSGFVNGESEQILDTPPSLIAYHPTEETFVNETSGVRDDYVINSITGSDNNYTFIWTLGTLTITKALLTVSANDVSKTYGEVNPTLTQTITGFVNGEDESDLTTVPVIETSANESSDAGTYIVSSSGGEADNYEFSYEDGTLTIEKAALSVIVHDETKIYGDNNPAFSQTITGYVNGDDQSDLTTIPLINSTANVTSTVGSYAITSSGGEADNYSFNYADGSLTINKATLMVVADDQSKSYGDANPTFTQTISGFVNDEDESSLGTIPILSTLAAETSIVGIYAINSSGGEASNYAFNYTDGSLTINKATLTVEADDQSKSYGDANPTFTQTISGFVNNEDESSLSAVPSLNSTASETSVVGSYTISSAGGEADNYTFDYITGTLTIEKAILNVIVEDESKTYGDANPSFTQTISGYVNDEDHSVLTTIPVISVSAGESSDAGTYSISSAGGEAVNYSFLYTSGTLTVNRALLTVTATDQRRSYGGQNPAFTYNLDGFVNGDDAGDLTTQPRATSEANNASSVGEYVINVSSGSDENYRFRYVSGTLEVHKALLTVIADDLTINEGQELPELTFTISGFVNNEGITDLDELPLTSVTEEANLMAGQYEITLSGGSDGNYDFDLNHGTLIVASSQVLSAFPESVDMEIYPNPVVELLYVKGLENTQDISIHLINLQGKRIELQPQYTYSGMRLNVSQIDAGLYMLLIRKGQDILFNQKLIVAK